MILGEKHRLTSPGISLRYGVGISIILSDSAFNRGYLAISIKIRPFQSKLTHTSTIQDNLIYVSEISKALDAQLLSYILLFVMFGP